MQHTVGDVIHIRGLGLHSGQRVTMSILPAPADTGFVFRRVDLLSSSKNPLIPVRYDTVVDTRLCTKVGNDDAVTVATIEHLFAAFAARSIDNAIIHIDSVEVPAMDGSSFPYLFLIDSVGVRKLSSPRRYLKILKPISVADEHWSLSIEPADTLSIHCTIEFPNTIIGTQTYDYVFTPDSFDLEISRARTFAQMQEIDFLRKNGLALGGSYDNAIVIDGMAVLNPYGLRYPDEFVRHKILDALGDIYLAGNPILGKLTLSCSGHRGNNLLLRALFAHSGNYSYILSETAPLSFGLTAKLKSFLRP